MAYRGILFDFFGVICSDAHTLWMQENGFSDKTDGLIREYYQYSDIGSLSPSALYESLGKLVGRSAAQVESEINAFIQIDPAVIDIIHRLHVEWKIGICSNAQTGYVEKMIETYGLQDDFDAYIISSAIHLRKPDREMFEKAAATLGLNPDEIIFIDDREYNVVAAREIGMTAIRFISAEQLSSDLRSLGVA